MTIQQNEFCVMLLFLKGIVLTVSALSPLKIIPTIVAKGNVPRDLLMKLQGILMQCNSFSEGELQSKCLSANQTKLVLATNLLLCPSCYTALSSQDNHTVEQLKEMDNTRFVWHGLQITDMM